MLNPKGELIGIRGRGDEYNNRNRDILLILSSLLISSN